jgi:nitronate monooxygenase
MLSPEAATAEAQRALLADPAPTRVTRAFSGRPARGLANRFMNEVEARGAAANLGYPTQNALTRPLRSEAARRDRPEFLSLWAGQGVRLARRGSAADLVSRVAAQIDETIERLTTRSAAEPAP